MTITAAALLDAYDEAARLHPIDRAVVLRSLDPIGSGGADEPLGLRNAGLLRLRASLVGPRLTVTARCPGCAERRELHIDLAALADSGGVPPVEVSVDGRRFTPITSRHLAAATMTHDDPAQTLLAACSLEDAPGTFDANAVGAALDHADPLADITFTLTCDDCAHEWEDCLDVPAVLWTEVGYLVDEILDDVHVLASAYGWSEFEVLDLSPQRRQAYIDRALS